MTVDTSQIEEESERQEAQPQVEATTAGWPHVLLYTDSDAFAGTERHMLDLAVGLRSQEVGVGIACPVPSPLAQRAASKKIPVTAIPKRGMLDKEAITILRNLLTTNSVQVIHSHNGRTELLAAVAVWRAKRGRCVATQHFIEPSRAGRTGIKGTVSKLVHRWVARHTDWFIAVSRAAERGMAHRGDARPGRVSVVANGISDFDRAQLRSRAEIRKELGIAENIPLIVCVARLQPEKDVATLVDAMSIVRQHFPSAYCVVAGDGAQQQMLEDKIKQSGVSTSMRLLGFYADAGSLIAASDVFVLPSVNEPFGLVLLEAMALGKPVVSTAAGGPLEIVEQDQTGLLATPKRPLQLAAAIRRVLEDPDLAQQFGSKGRSRFESHFTVDVMAAATASIYRHIIESDN